MIVFITKITGLKIYSCKKEESAKPSAKAEKGVMLGEKKDMGGWD